jgi:hypothetical protein
MHVQKPTPILLDELRLLVSPVPADLLVTQES